MAMTSVSVMMTVFVLNLHYRGPKKNEIPFWLQQLLSLSLANVVRTFRKSKKSHKIKEDLSKKKSNENEKNYPSINGLILSYMNINETRAKTRTTTTDVRILYKIQIGSIFSFRPIQCKLIIMMFTNNQNNLKK
jgi:hypothetical protein